MTSSVDLDHCDVRKGKSGIHLEGAGNTVHWGTGNIDADPVSRDVLVNAVLYFSRDEASFVSGQTLCVNDGRTPW